MPEEVDLLSRHAVNRSGDVCGKGYCSNCEKVVDVKYCHGGGMFGPSDLCAECGGAYILDREQLGIRAWIDLWGKDLPEEAVAQLLNLAGIMKSEKKQ